MSPFGLLCLAVCLLSASTSVFATQEQAPAAALPQAVPVGSILAFMPQMTGADYRDAASLRHWLDEQGWAICDGRGGTPDLRHRMLIGARDAQSAGQRLGSRDHDHQVQATTDVPLRRHRQTPTGRMQQRPIPDETHRHAIDTRSSRAEHLPLSTRVLFIMKVR